MAIQRSERNVYPKRFFLFLVSFAFPLVGLHSLRHHPCPLKLISLSFYPRSLSIPRYLFIFIQAYIYIFLQFLHYYHEVQRFRARWGTTSHCVFSM
ncbi:hypothetical protein EDC04DRAFT_2722345 [Pisolithus marmoratus]|nr:hypothetical protein EDC04DRAFT_2722345 [Pisolithus marmoratus]